MSRIRGVDLGISTAEPCLGIVECTRVVLVCFSCHQFPVQQSHDLEEIAGVVGVTQDGQLDQAAGIRVEFASVHDNAIS